MTTEQLTAEIARVILDEATSGDFACFEDEAEAFARAIVARVPLVGAAVEMRTLLSLTCERWTFSKDQQHTHTWHEWAGVVPRIGNLLAKLPKE